jgi:hypothetical protein
LIDAFTEPILTALFDNRQAMPEAERIGGLQRLSVQRSDPGTPAGEVD